jgi:hypothetical protein
MIITLTEKDLDTSLTDSGQVIDVLALSMNEATQNEVDESAMDYDYTVIDYVIENYDFEKAFIEMLNEEPTKLKEYEKIYISSGTDLLAGAWLALEYPEVFDKMLTDWTDKIKSTDRFDLEEPKDLIEELQEAVDDYHDRQYQEWLNGDYGNWSGILPLAEKKYECADVSYNGSENALSFEYTDEQGKAFIADLYAYDSEEVVFSPELLKKDLADMINSNAAYTVNKEKQKREEQKAERDRVKAYQEEQKQKAEAERKAKLLSMKKK